MLKTQPSGDEARALERYNATSKWRENIKLNDILTQSQPYYHILKAHTIAYFHKTDLLGETNDPNSPNNPL